MQDATLTAAQARTAVKLQQDAAQCQRLRQGRLGGQYQAQLPHCPHTICLLRWHAAGRVRSAKQALTPHTYCCGGSSERAA